LVVLARQGGSVEQLRRREREELKQKGEGEGQILEVQLNREVSPSLLLASLGSLLVSLRYRRRLSHWAEEGVKLGESELA